MQTFGEQLTAARKAKGMTQEALAQAAAVTRQDRQLAFAHHFKPLFDIIQSDMRVVIVGIACGIESDAVVLHDYLNRLACLFCYNGNMYRIVAFAHAVLDGVFHYRLQRKRRYAERSVRRIEVYKQRILKLRLLNGEVCSGML